jgi:hypothetical protein
MKYIQLFEEVKYTTEHKKLISTVRYYLTKFFGKNVGVSKVRSIRNRYGNYDDYNGPEMLFDIYVGSLYLSDEPENYEEKLKFFSEIMVELGFSKSEPYDVRYSVNEEQMKQIINRIKFLQVEFDARKYNL